MKKLTILHSSDMHGAFLPEEKDGKKVEGLAVMELMDRIRKEMGVRYLFE